MTETSTPRSHDVSKGDDEEVEPVELLVQLAEEGEIEPWDIDIVEVTDAFLDRLDESDLRTSGRALFYAAVLLRMKSDAIVESESSESVEESSSEPAPWEAPLTEPGPPPGGDPVETLEAEMNRRLERKSARGTPETLDELVRELREAERGSWWKSSRSYDTSDSPRGFRRGVQTVDYRVDDAERQDHEPTQADVTGTTHTEDIEALVTDVSEALEDRYAQEREQVLFAEIQTVAGSRVQTFLALLFLSHRGRIRLEQDELFGDLYIQNRSD